MICDFLDSSPLNPFPMFLKLKIKNALPVIFFCGVFLLTCIYFVKVVSAPIRLERNSIARSIQRSWEPNEHPLQKPGPMTTPQVSISPNFKPQKLPSRPAIFPLSNPALDESAKTESYVDFAWLNVRKAPTTASSVMEKIYKDEQVWLFSKSDNGWSHIRTKSGKEGYVSSKYLTEKKPILRSTKSSFEGQASNQPASQQTSYHIPTITYHHISDSDKYGLNLNLAMANFVAQLDYLVANKVSTLTFYDLEALQKGQMVTPDKGVILTFDDGYDDAYQVAQNLNGKGLKGVFFVITGKVGMPGYLTWDQVKKMRSWGMEIGSHSVHHPDLVNSSISDVKKELADSKKILEEKLSDRIISFSYPASRFNAVVVSEVKNAGYLFARTEVPGKKYSEKDFLQLPTLRVFPPAGARQFKVWLEK